MNQHKLIIAGCIAGLIAAVIFGPSAAQNYRVRKEAAKLRQVLNDLGQHDPGIRQGTSEEPRAGTQDRRDLFKVKEAYDRLDWRQGVNAGNLASLAELSRGLKSSNEAVRETTGDIVRYVLTEWVLRTNPENWRQSPELNAFFKFYKENGSRSLTSFLQVYPDGPESKYLKSI